MQIYLARNNQQAGPYTVEQLNQMLASQQVLLTDLAWHQGMSEWKALGELTQGKLSYAPQGYTAPVTTPQTTFPQTTQQTPTAAQPNNTLSTTQDLASLAKRFLAKVLDLLLWLPALVIPTFFLKPEQIEQLGALQQKMQNAATSTEAQQVQGELWTLIPAEAWQAMLIYIFIMLVIQAVLLAKTGQSIGKRLTKIQIVDAENGQKVNLMRAFTLRSFFLIFLTILAFPFITVIDSVFAFGKTRQTLHDKLAKTKVINKS